MPKKSDVWKHFTRLTDDNGKPIDQAKCNNCHKVLKRESTTGTSNMWRHFNKFHKQEVAAVGASQSLALPTSAAPPSGSHASKDSKPGAKEAYEANVWLTLMIANGGYDPAILDDLNFRSFAHSLNPEFKVPSRRVIEARCDGRCTFELPWDSYHSGNFSLSGGRAKTMGREVLYLAYHATEDDWAMIDRKVLYAYDVSSFTDYCHNQLSGLLPEASLELLADNIISDIPEGAGLFMMACERTDVTFSHNLTDRIKQALGPRMSKGPFCATYMDEVIHSIARHLLPDTDFRKRMFSAVNNLKLTRQGRKDLLKKHGLDDPWEYDELWYSCYCSLQVLRKEYSSSIATADFEVIGMLCDVWGKFYGAIKRISDPYLPTSHLCLAELFTLRQALQPDQLQLGQAASDSFVDGLRRAKDALDEAIRDSYMVWSIPLVMDPRYRLEYIQVLFKTAFDTDAADDYIAKIKANIKDLYSNYFEGDLATDTNVGGTDRLLQARKRRRRALAKTYLDRYLDDTIVPENQFDHVGGWWKSTGSVRYPKVAEMARDALAMPTCSKLSSEQIVQVKSIIRGYYSKDPEEEDEDDEEDEDEEDEDGSSGDQDGDAMIQ